MGKERFGSEKSCPGRGSCVGTLHTDYMLPLPNLYISAVQYTRVRNLTGITATFLGGQGIRFDRGQRRVLLCVDERC
jgi:hypothetical protein